jgi:hypothetical protein
MLSWFPSQHGNEFHQSVFTGKIVPAAACALLATAWKNFRRWWRGQEMAGAPQITAGVAMATGDLKNETGSMQLTALRINATNAEKLDSRRSVDLRGRIAKKFAPIF